MNHSYRKRPVVIQAFQMTRERRDDYRDWPEWLKTLEGPMRVSWDDWIIRGVKGEIYACKPDIFEATYEPVE